MLEAAVFEGKNAQVDWETRSRRERGAGERYC